SGICPPSKYSGTWYRALVPLVPRPAVLPFDASPRPTRVLAVLAPGAGRRLWIFSGFSLSPEGAISVDLLDRDEVPHRAQLTAHNRVVLAYGHIVDTLQTERPERVPVVLLGPDNGTLLRDLQAG